MKSGCLGCLSLGLLWMWGLQLPPPALPGAILCCYASRLSGLYVVQGSDLGPYARQTFYH